METQQFADCAAPPAGPGMRESAFLLRRKAELEELAKKSFGPGGALLGSYWWRAALSALGLLNGDLAERDITLCFSWIISM